MRRVVFVIVLMLAALGGTGSSAQAERAPWQLLHGDQANSKYRALAGPEDLERAWYSLPMKPPGVVVAVSPTGERYTVTMDEGPCHLYAMNAAGETLWCSSEIGPALTSPAVADDGAVFVDDGSKIVAFERTGAIRWQRPVPPSIDPVNGNTETLGLTFNKGYLILLDADGVVRALDPATGNDVADPYEIGAARTPDGTMQATSGFEQIGVASSYVNRLQRLYLGYKTVVNNSFGIDPSGRMFIAANRPDSTTAGRLYGIDFQPPENGQPGSITEGCHGDMGARSQTSPTVSLDGRHVYAGDASGGLFAFSTSDCHLVWDMPPLGSGAPASPTVGPNGRIYLLVGGKLVAARDNSLAGQGTGVSPLWTLDTTPRAVADGYVGGAINSTVLSTENFLYASGNFTQQAPGSTSPADRYPARSFLYTIDLNDGQIVSSVEVGELSAASLSTDGAGRVYVPTKALGKGTALNKPSTSPYVPAPATGVYAFEPSSYMDLARSGIEAARERIESSRQANPDTAATARQRTRLQIVVAKDNAERALSRGEIDEQSVCAVKEGLDKAAALVSDESATAAQVLEVLDRSAEGLRAKGPAGSCPTVTPPPSSPQEPTDETLEFLIAGKQVVPMGKGRVRLGCRQSTKPLRSCSVSIRSSGRSWTSRSVAPTSPRTSIVFSLALRPAARKAIEKAGKRGRRATVRAVGVAVDGSIDRQKKRVRIGGKMGSAARHDRAGEALYQNCFWTGPRGIGFGTGSREANQYPDADATYWFAKFVLPPGGKLEVKGKYPHARYMSYHAYNATGQPTDRVYDAAITPDPGSLNPFRAGAKRDSEKGRSYTVNVLAEAPPANESDREKNTLYAAAGQEALTVVYRIYANDLGTDVAGNQPLPVFTVIGSDGSRIGKSAACDKINTPDHDTQVRTPLTVEQWQDLENTPGLDPSIAPATPKPEFRRFFSAIFNIFGDFRPETRTTLSPPDTGGLYSNIDNRYIYAHLNRRFGKVVTITGKMPTFPATYRGQRRMGSSQVRYWSICSNDGPVSGQASDCASDYGVPLRGDRRFTIVISKQKDKPRNATKKCGVLWLNWSERGDAAGDPDYNLVIIRSMLAADDFENSIQSIDTYGTEREVMGDYYPNPRYTSKADFQQRGCRR